MIKINILGSNVSRDIFRYDKEKKFTIPIYIARSSICSNLQKQSWNVKDEDISLGSFVQREAVVRDLNKSVLSDLKNEKSVNYLLVDFIDERFKIAKKEDKYATYSNELKSSGFLKEGEFTFLDKVQNRIGPGYTFEGRDLDKYIRKFALELLKAYRPEQIVLHEAYMVNMYISKDGERKTFSEPICRDVRNKNRMLNYMYGCLKKYIPGMHVMNLMLERKFMANEAHVWGLSPIHYEDDYYLEAINYLDRLNLQKEKTKIQKNVSEFNAADVDIILDEHGSMTATNSFFVDHGETIYYSWYINKIENGRMNNIYKSSQWSTDNTFRYNFEAQDVSAYVLISYVRYKDKRESRIIANISSDGEKIYLNRKLLTDFSKNDLSIKTDEVSININVNFKGLTPLKYAFYVFKTSTKECIYKSKSFSDESLIKYIPEDANGTYLFWIYIKDLFGNRAVAKTDAIKIRKNVGTFGFTIEEFNCNMSLPSDETVLKWAKEMLNGKLYVHKDFHEPADIKNGIDWNMQFTFSPGTYQLWLHSLGMVAILTKAYFLSGNTTFLYKANQFLTEWVEYEDTGGSTENVMVWHDHGSALRANSIIYFALATEHANVLDKNGIDFFKQLIRRHSIFLSNEKNYTRNHNHGIFQDQSLLYCSYFLKDDHAEKYIRIASDRLKSQIEFAFNEEKVHVENSAAYHIALLYILCDISDFLQKMDDPFAYYVRENIKESADFCAYLNRPSGNLINTGDSSIDSHRIKYDTTAAKLESDAYLYSMTQGEFGAPNKTWSAVFPKSGYYFYKQDKSIGYTFCDTTWKMFKAGYSSRTHKHADDLSFAMCSKGHDIFIDTGYYNYAIGEKFCDYFKSPLAHNTITVDGKTYSTENEESYRTGIIDYKLGGKTEYVTGYNNMYQGTSIYRTFYSAHDLTILHDYATSKESHEYVQIFHLSEVMSILQHDNNEVLLQILNSSYKVRIRQLAEKSCTLKIIQGDKYYTNNEEKICGGYASFGQNKVTPITTLRFVKKGKDIEFVTIITIEDENGEVICNIDEANATRINYTDISYHSDIHAVHIVNENIPLKKIYNTSKIHHEINGNMLTVYDMGEKYEKIKEYEYEIIDVDTGLIIHKKLYSRDSTLYYEMPSKDVIIKAKIRRNGKECYKKSIALYEYDSESQMHHLSKKEPLNLIYKGHVYRLVEGNRYMFHVDIEYSLDYQIKWYVYKNGVYESNALTINESDFQYDFKSSGRYTVSYYISTITGEKYFYNFEAIKMEDENE